jgi:hypothetical protein
MAFIPNGQFWGTAQFGSNSSTSNKTNSSNVNYDDPRFDKVESDKTAALDELENTYSGMIGQSDKYYQDQINASKEWADKQTELQQNQTDFAIEQIEQQKDQANKDYIKEQSGAYVDWQKQSNQYGANAEQMASAGLTNTGYSESSQVSMYNTYQNRVSTAREAYNNAVLNYNNAIKDARLQNNAALAEIAYNALQQQLELSLQGFQYKNSLVLELSNKKLEVENNYYNRYMDVLNQINTENALAEEIRQFNEQMALEKGKMEGEMYAWMYEHGLLDTGSSSSSNGSKKTNKNYKVNNDSSSSDALPSDTRDSILNLGMGPISEEYLKKQIDSGKVTVGTSTTTGNPIVFKNNLIK